WEDEDWLADLRRESLLESLLADGTIAAAVAAEHGHKQERALNAEATALCLVTGALFPVLGYDSMLALVFGMPGLPVRPGTPVPAGPAYSKARERHGEAPALAMFTADAARTDIPAGQDGTAFGLEITQIDGTTLELFNDPLLAEEFGIPAPGAKPLLRLVGLLHSGTRRWKAAVTGRYLDGENALADGLQDASGPGQLNLADRGFFSMDRWLRFSGTGAHLLWRVKNSAKSVPFRTLHVLKDGSELVLLRESNSMPARRRKAAGDPALPSLPDTTARLICFTVLTRTRGGRVKTAQIRLLTTLLDPDTCPAAELAVLYQKRWLIEVAFLHLKRTVRGAGRVLRGRSAALVRQEAWALLLAHNIIAGLAARAAATTGLTPGEITFTAVLSLARAAITADTCCPHCHKRPASGNAPTAGLGAAITALPPGRAGRQRTSGRTPAERRKWISEPADYTLTIVPSNLPKTDVSLRS
ncbi:MAG TPA: IS4 family transposase, partial [Streptosporangiaceae bacterium]|nr:IS4 family transposase [Streptosporangiaceae bacterium]